MRYLIFKKSLFVVFIGFFILASTVFAQQETEQSAQVDEQKKPQSDGKVFKPSEEISEDSPVPFPVDI